MAASWQLQHAVQHAGAHWHANQFAVRRWSLENSVLDQSGRMVNGEMPCAIPFLQAAMLMHQPVAFMGIGYTRGLGYNEG